MAEKVELNLTPEQVDAIQALRAERKVTIADNIALQRVRTKTMTRIKRLVAQKPMTSPELVDEMGTDPELTIWCLIALKRYEGVVEGKKDGDYFRYYLPTADGNVPGEEA